MVCVACSGSGTCWRLEVIVWRTCSVLSVSKYDRADGEAAAIITVCELPPSESSSRKVSLLER